MQVATRKYYENKIKDKFGIPRHAEDGLLSNIQIYEVINDSMDRVADDLELNSTILTKSRVAGMWKYDLMPQILSIRNAWILSSNGEWNSIDYEQPEVFLGKFNEKHKSNWPEAWAIFGRARETFNWNTQNGITIDQFVPHFYVCESSPDEVICYGANFGSVYSDSDSIIRKGDVIWNVDDDAYGFIDWLDFTTEKAEIIVETYGDGHIIADSSVEGLGIDRGDVVTQLQLDEYGTYEKSFAYVVGARGRQLDYSDIQGKPFGVNMDDAHNFLRVSVGTSDKIKMKRFGESLTALRGGLRNQFVFEMTDEKEIRELKTTTFDADTIRIDGLNTAVQAGMIIRPITETYGVANSGERRCAEIININSDRTEATVRYWMGGLPETPYNVQFGIGDKFQIQSRFRTRDSLWLRPTPSQSDTNIERVRLLMIPLPEKPDSDDDPIEIDFRYNPPLLASMYRKAAEAQSSYSDIELQRMENVYKMRIEETRPFSQTPTGQPLSVAPEGVRQQYSGISEGGGHSFGIEDGFFHKIKGGR